MSTGKSPVTCHVLDASLGKPAKGVEVRLQKHHQEEGQEIFSFVEIAHGVTNDDGRCIDFLPPVQANGEGTLSQGLYKVIFRIDEYFQSTERASFYPWVEITFKLNDPNQHYHIPLLISPFSYTTYRGS